MQLYTSRNTSVNKNRVPSIVKKIEKYGAWKDKGINFDIGSGKYDTMTNYLKDKYNILNIIYDPYNIDLTSNIEYLVKIKRLSDKLSCTCTLSNVLCVINSYTERIRLLNLAKLLCDTIFITVYEGDKSGIGRVTKKDCWQNNKRLSEYIDEVKEVFKKSDIKIKYNMIIIENKERRNQWKPIQK